MAVIACLVVGAGAMGAGPSDTGPDRIDVSTFPPEMQEYYLVFAEKCSKCHTLARPINSQLKGDDWKNYIKKMIRRPSSGINQEAGRRIFEFLKFYSDRRDGSAGLLATGAHAEELPVLLQVQLLSKISAYVETLVSEGSDVTVLVVFAGPADSPTQGAQDLLSALNQVGQFGAFKVQPKVVPFADGKKFRALLEAEKPGILYLAPELDAKVTAAIIEACAERPTVTISGNADSVKLGVVLGFSLVEARPRVLVNLKQAGRQKITFRPGLVSHSVVVDR